MAFLHTGKIHSDYKKTVHLFLSLKNLIRNTFYDFCSPIHPLVFDAQKTMGVTYGKNPIAYHCIGNGENKIVFISGIHGNEVGTVKFAHCLIQWLNKNSRLRKELTLFVVPCLNIDGFLLARRQKDYIHGGRIGRCNGNNVDLNRNFATKSFQSKAYWNYGLHYGKKSEVYAGAFGNSEPETKVLVDFIEKEKIKTIISFHNSGKDITASNDTHAQQLAAMYSATTHYRLIPEQEWKNLAQTGTLKEWCEEHALTYLEIETSNRYTSDWRINKKAIITILQHI